MDVVGSWQAKASDGISATASTVPGHDGKALRLDWDFAHVSGYAYVRRPLPITLPDNYAISLWVRWSGGTNNLEFKLVDESGENVWWVSRPDIKLKPGWQKLVFRKRDVEFAWGPATDKVLRKAASIEFVVSRGKDGGRGSLDIDQLELTELPTVAATLPAPRLNAPDGDSALAMDGKPATIWSGKGPLTIDFGGAKEFGGVVLRWASPPPDYGIETSINGSAWDKRRTVVASDGGSDPIALPETEARYLRIVPVASARLAEVEIKPLDWAATPNAFIAALAREAPRGTYPRGFSGEQSYWTLIGTDGGAASGLIGEDGAVEIGKGAFSIEPLVKVGGKRFSWADVKATPSLAQGYLPIPSVTWDGPGWTLEARAFSDPAIRDGRMMLRYVLRNKSAATVTAELLLAVRPFQVNPPAQFLSQRGGVSEISRLRWRGGKLEVSGAGTPVTVVQPLSAPNDLAIARFDSGDALPTIASSAKAGVQSRDRRNWTPALAGEAVVDETGLASAALSYDVALAPGEARTIDLAVSTPGKPLAPVASTAAFDAAERATIAYWRDRLDRVAITVPPGKQALADTVRTSLAHILMSREGPMLRPGTRSYARSWIRDGAMISEGLLRLDQPEIVAAYADWYTPFIFANGKVPCCVDFKGADPVPENDSHGEYIFLATQLYRYTGDRARLNRHWPAILGAERYMETLRAETQNAAPMLRGLMPPSISHEGYSAKPQYSLWDDFWALRGYKDAAFAAETLGKAEALEIALNRDAFQVNVHRAIAAAATHFKIGYIPGATSLGDFDATSTTMGLDPAGEQSRLDPVLLAGTFDRYWRDFIARRDGIKAWQDYTPYELRTVSAMIRLGKRERVDPMLDFFFADRRPQAWNGWAEVVGKNPREIRFIGDMPHAWISSDFIRAALDMFAYERADDGALVLGAGLSDAYLDGPGSSIRGLRTPHGDLDLTIRATPARLLVTIGGMARPTGGFVLPWPWRTMPRGATINGEPARFTTGVLLIPATGRPITVEVSR
ncbi:discoidin domain-containing protein [Sphingomonas alpina]|uniref:Discoidin domain-containing protein n=1 Tax=Sphingomonas alpina TaxID=653931 RepID=A0A7H0LJE7_9SPHN|nr:discoidin domain-containing protein [Sphingomonas alpina]QNQ09800.1 discoidin domain-containing protein [Sphingomonas alpina]